MEEARKNTGILSDEILKKGEFFMVKSFRCGRPLRTSLQINFKESPELARKG
jgi:hypothetical protein